MGDTFVINGLIQKRAEILGLALDLEARAKKVRADLVHIDAAILLFDPDARPAAIKAKRPSVASNYFAMGERSRRVREALRAATAPLSAEDIALPLMTEKGLDPEDSKLRGKLICSVLNALASMLARGDRSGLSLVVRDGQREARPRLRAAGQGKIVNAISRQKWRAR